VTIWMIYMEGKKLNRLVSGLARTGGGVEMCTCTVLYYRYEREASSVVVKMSICQTAAFQQARTNSIGDRRASTPKIKRKVAHCTISL
jgi:hypothetical protein